MEKVININESELVKIIQSVMLERICYGDNLLRENKNHVNFGKFKTSDDVALNHVRGKFKDAINNNLIDPSLFSFNKNHELVYTGKLPVGTKINTRTYEITRDNTAGRKSRRKNSMTLEEFKKKYPNEEFVPLIYKGNANNDKITQDIIQRLSERYSISSNGYIIDHLRDVVVKPYEKTDGSGINLRLPLEGGGVQFHGNTSIESLLKLSFNKNEKRR